MIYRIAISLLAAALVTVSATRSATAADRIKAAVFGFEFVDASHEGALNGVRADQEARLVRVNDLFRKMLAKGGLALVDLGPLHEKVAAASPIRTCNGCEVAIARELGADIAVSGIVRKTSNLILSLAFVVRDARNGKNLRVASAQIRGNTDESWMRGVRWLVRNRLFDPPLTLSR